MTLNRQDSKKKIYYWIKLYYKFTKKKTKKVNGNMLANETNFYMKLHFSTQNSIFQHYTYINTSFCLVYQCILNNRTQNLDFKLQIMRIEDMCFETSSIFVIQDSEWIRTWGSWVTSIAKTAELLNYPAHNRYSGTIQNKYLKANNIVLALLQ